MSIANELAAIVGATNVLTGDDIDARYRTDLMGRFATVPGYVVKPASTDEVSRIVKLAAARQVPVTPLGGGTGLVGGGTADNGAILLSLERMRQIVEIDPRSMTMTVEAGAILQHVHEAAEEAGLLMPLDLGARGSATVGGNIATNAGGVRVLRWGTMREMVLGVEAVLADGTIVSSLTKAIKDNAGYNWKQLLIGSEGTLGIVTRAVLRLRPLPTSTHAALVACDTFETAADLLRRAESTLAGLLSSFEFMWDDYYSEMIRLSRDNRKAPLPTGHPIYALIEIMGSDPDRDGERLEAFLTQEMGNGAIQDAVIARSERERRELWDIREGVAASADMGYADLEYMVALDVGMALADMAAFVEDSRARVLAAFPDAHVMYLGHAGDGNLHVVVQGARSHQEVHAMHIAVYKAVEKVGGSISAEHGVGRSKIEYLPFSRSPSELHLMRVLKKALDPMNILNPGKVLPA